MFDNMPTEILSRERIIIVAALIAAILTMVSIWATFEYLKPKQEDDLGKDEDSDHLLDEEAPDPEITKSDYDMVFTHDFSPAIVAESPCRAIDDSVLIANLTVDDSLATANNDDEDPIAGIDRFADRLVKPKLKGERDRLSTQLIDLISRIDETLEDRESIVVFQTSGLSSLRSSIATSIEQMDVKQLKEMKILHQQLDDLRRDV